jgi:hypothetical protein
MRVWFVSVCRKTTLTPGINPPEVSLIVPSNVPLVLEFCAADAATPARTSSSTNKALASERLADNGWIQRTRSDNYFDRAAEIDEATIVLPEMVPLAVTI